MANKPFYRFAGSNEKRRAALLAVSFLTYIVFFRTYDITGTFLLLGEQIRDWSLALGKFTDLPLTGAPSTAGGRGFGPVYYWILWAGRHLIGPFTENLPHAGGLTVALLQAIGDTWLFVALMTRIGWPLALAVSLLVATQPFDVGLSKAIWNPPVATALIKMTMAQMLMLGETPRIWKIVAVAATAWFAVQAHSSGFFVAMPVFVALVAMALFAKEWKRAATIAGVIAGTILVLEIPYVISQIKAPEKKMGPTVVFDSLAKAAEFKVAQSFTSVVNIAGELVMHKHDAWSFGLVTLVACVVAVWRWRKDLPMLAITVGPLLTTTFLFSTWTRPYESYWFMSITAPLVLTIALLITAIPQPRIAFWAGVPLLLLVMWWQPERFEDSKAQFSYPQYRAILAGSRAAVAREPVLRVLSLGFKVEDSTDPTFLYRILGGRIERNRPFVAEIQADGTVVFTPVP